MTPRFRSLVASALVTLLVVATAAPALAVGPKVEGNTLLDHGFEPGQAGAPTLSAWEATEPSTAWWGVTTKRKASGSYGLWCATQFRSVTDPNVELRYPIDTDGVARFSLPELADYYSARASFKYFMPSYGSQDDMGFRFGWGAPGASGLYQQYPFPTVSAWTSKSYSLSDTSAPLDNFSRRAADLRFHFYDNSGAYAESPATGEGPSIDDVLVTAFKFGPVRALSATVVDGHVHLTWGKPQQSTGNAADDARPMVFRVWRQPASGGEWVELTGASPEVDLDFVDETPPANRKLRYAVQAYDSVLAEAKWGEVAYVESAAIPGAETTATMAVGVTVDKTIVGTGKSVKFTYTVRNTGDAVLSAVKVATVSGTMNAATTLAPDATATVTVTKALSSALSAVPQATASSSLGAVSGNGLPVVVSVIPSRISGATRTSTAVEISKRGFPAAGSAKTVVLASGMAWQDALPASALAGAVGGPLLLVDAARLPAEVGAELTRLGAKTAYVVGAKTSVSDTVLTALRGRGVTPIRVTAPGAYGTQQAVAQRVADVRSDGKAGGTVFVATAGSFADALGASSLAAAMRAPILLTTPSALPSETKAALGYIKPSKVVIVGGANSVSPAVEAALKSSAYGSPVVVRRQGANRYDTAKSIVDYGKSVLAPGGVAGVYLATGENFPDALAGGALAGLGGGRWTPIMLTAPASLSPQAYAVVRGSRPISFVSVLGGPRTVSDAVVRQAQLAAR